MNCIKAKCQHCKGKLVLQPFCLYMAEVPNGRITKTFMDVYCDLGKPIKYPSNDNGEPLDCKELSQKGGET